MKYRPGDYRDGIRMLKDVRDRCKIDTDTGCWHWPGAFSSGKGEWRFTPRAYFSPTALVTSVLRIVMACKTKDDSWAKPHGNPLTVWRTCRNGECVCPNHLATGTFAEFGAWQRTWQRKNPPDVRAKMAAAKRAKSTKVTQEIANAIVASTEAPKVLADRYGLSFQHISKIRRGEIWASHVRSASVFNFRP